ncbi:right-handed parallel beta-helix repeat-containing protein [Sutcliffiella horikoshii]|uniref:Right-handed parallel beta-helix repeat-containing protein n=1 Tax=Sutcliffiella horikoshii TaxID=79883 RepID=A0AA94WR03_9BACI|nr:right-handed parallel beta-helix repeat-containing protein [Sutcliffiella horikoshii]TYS60086.1 right-handed parallel beta-helix repeat-containing protein [Sutcliffiella horikoshii]
MLTSITYIIELDRWGIKKGLPIKPYQATEYQKAYANIQGINNALNYAKDRGFREVVLPEGEYAICYPLSIEMKTNVTFNMQNVILKVLYDSDSKSPYDTRTGTDYYNFIGNSIVFRDVVNAHLVGGKLIGCRYDRSFNNPNEKKQEHTYGILFTNGTSHSSVKHCEVSQFMGDGISISSTSSRDLAEFNLGLTKNDIDKSTGELIPSNNSLVSTFISLRDTTTFSIGGFGYNRTTSILTKEVDVFFYREDNSYLLKRQMNRKIYSPISIPEGAKKIRLVFRQETNPSKNMNITLKFADVPNHNIIEFNEIYGNHRGGITLGGSHNIVQSNIIRDNGFHTLDDKPLFYDPTRYGINQEDSYGDSCKIRDNLIYNTNHGILAGCYSVFIENNHIYNVTGVGIILYTLSFASVKGNYLFQCAVSALQLASTTIPGAHVHFTDNSINKGIVNLSVDGGYKLNMQNNTFVDVERINILGDSLKSSFQNNTIKFTKFYSRFEPVILIQNIQETKFETDSELFMVKFITESIKRCTFSNIRLNLQTKDQSTDRGKITISNCLFNNSSLRNHLFMVKTREVHVENCEFNNSNLQAGNTNTPDENPIFLVKNCKFNVNSYPELVLCNDLNRETGFAVVSIINSEISISNPYFGKLVTASFTPKSVVLELKDNNIHYINNPPLKLDLTNRLSSIRKFISSNNLFENISWVAPSNESFYVGYDPETHAIQEPDSGYYSIGKIIYNAHLSSNNLFGWVCVKEGFANQANWTANTAISKGTRINFNDIVYQSENDGITGSVPPTQTNGSAIDGSVQWIIIGMKAVFEQVNK